MSRISTQPVSSFSPYYGCAIMAAAMLIFVGIISWSAYTLFKQDSEIGKFAVATPLDFPPLAPTPEQEQTLRQKLQQFQRQLNTENPNATLDLTLPEINLLLLWAPDLGSGSYADIVRFTRTDTENQTLHADLSMQLNNLPFSKKPKRYLVGQATFTPEIHTEGPDVRITAIQIPDGEVPAGFIDSQHLWTWLAPYRKDPTLAAQLKAIRSLKITPEGIQLSTHSP